MSRLHTASSSPHLAPVGGGGGGGRDLEFAVGLQDLGSRCQKLLEVLEEKGKEDMMSECNIE